MSELLDLARLTAALAQKKGAGEAHVSAYRTRDVEARFRNGAVERVTEATTRGVSLSLYVDHRYSAVATSDLRPEALDRFVEDCVAMTRALAVDPHRALPDPKLYAGRSTADLKLYDPAHGAITPEARRDTARRMEDAARGVRGSEAIVSVTTSVSDSRSSGARVHTNGFEGEADETTYSLYTEVSVKDADGRRPAESGRAAARRLVDLPPPGDVGGEAGRRAVAALGAVKARSGATTIVLENRAGRGLLPALLGPLAGRALQQKQSFLDGQAGRVVGSPLLTVTDDPLLPGGLASRLWDFDGLATKRRPVFARGVLETYLIDVYYGRKLGLAPTTGMTTNLVVPPGTKPVAALLQEVKDGLFVTAFLGGNNNPTTGDYSLGILGRRIRNGVLAEAISEMNMSGNQNELWKGLVAVGDDPYPWSTVRTPALVFEGVQVAGA